MALPHVSHIRPHVLPEPAYQSPLLSGQQMDCINRSHPDWNHIHGRGSVCKSGYTSPPC